MRVVKPAKLSRSPDFAIDVLAMAAWLDIDWIKCDLGSWEDAPHTQLDEDHFLAALEAEGKAAKVVYVAFDYLGPDDSVAYVMSVCGLPWIDEDEKKGMWSDELLCFQCIEDELAAIIKDFLGRGPTWCSFEAYFDVPGLLRKVVTAKPPWFEVMDRAIKYKFGQLSRRLVAWRSEANPDGKTQ